MNRRLRGGISAAVCALVLTGCGGGGGGDSTAAQASPASQIQNNGVQPPSAAVIKIADVGITPTNALRPGTKVDFVVSGTFPSGTTYLWEFGDATPMSNGASASHTYSKVGQFTVKVTASDKNGQKSFETRTVDIVANQPPVVSGVVSTRRISTGLDVIGARSNSVNLGQVDSLRTVDVAVNATDPQGDSLTYKWLIDGVAYGQATSSSMLSYGFSTGGTHLITVVVTDEYGGQTSHDFPITLDSSSFVVRPSDPSTSTGYAVWKASYTAQPVGRIRVASNGTAWALPITHPQVVRSTDNGRSWQELTLPKDDSVNGGNGFLDIGFADDKNIWVVGCPQQKSSAVEGGWRIDFNYAAVMHSSNAGSSWENVSVGGGLESRCKRAVQFVGQHGWIVDDTGSVINTTDGGKTWHFQADAALSAERMQFIDAQNGWIIGAARNSSKLQISRTTDGGTTWTVSKMPAVEMNSYASVFFVDAKTGYASGSLWSSAPYPVLKTTDGGATWSAVAVPKSSLIRDLVFNTPTSGYALDTFGSVYGTKDGGLTWAVIGVQSESATGGLGAFALGSNSTLLGTSSSTYISGKRPLLGAESLGSGSGISWLALL
ncbi:PKD domain-containing protein [Caballeronia sp. dw_19]|uniref:PKD domain-containing protein n=1 Tax=Caballeronia sp. dw_19 TaxID=2719791 RepID=UPI001BD4F8D3|nr:PKD domain-containing protein [Caballeronia sp. dw_19]